MSPYGYEHTQVYNFYTYQALALPGARLEGTWDSGHESQQSSPVSKFLRGQVSSAFPFRKLIPVSPYCAT